MHLVISRAGQVARTGKAAAAAVSAGQSTDGAPATGRVITVVSPKGGVGQDHPGDQSGRRAGQDAADSTVLVDLDIQFGDVASGLNLDPEYFLADAVHGPASQDTMVLKTFLTLHETGLYVICAPDIAGRGRRTSSAADVARLLEMLAAEFHYVVVDTAPGLSEHTLAAIDESTDLVLLTSMDVPGSVACAKNWTRWPSSLLPEIRHVVLNFADPRGGLSPPTSRPRSVPASTSCCRGRRPRRARSTRRADAAERRRAIR